MTGQEVYNVLIGKRVTHLYHANSVKTSLSQIRCGGLASRQLVESHGLPQTNQISDNDDKRYGIWGDIFLDTVDIHSRMSNRNHYGPVLFVLKVEILLSIPTSSRVLVAKYNPTKWADLKDDAAKYFMSADELEAGIRIGNFDHMLVIKTNSGTIPFSNYLDYILLDEPKLIDGTSPEFDAAFHAIHVQASSQGLSIDIERRTCPSCNCLNGYAKKDTLIPYFYNLP